MTNKHISDLNLYHEGWSSEDSGPSNVEPRLWQQSAIYRKGGPVDPKIRESFPYGGYRILNEMGKPTTNTEHMSQSSLEAYLNDRPDHWEDKLGDLEQNALLKFEEVLMDYGVDTEKFMTPKVINWLRRQLLRGVSPTKITNSIIKLMAERKVYISSHNKLCNALVWWGKTLNLFQGKDIAREQREEPEVVVRTDWDALNYEDTDSADWYDRERPGPVPYIRQDRVNSLAQWLRVSLCALKSRKTILETGHKMLMSVVQSEKEGKAKRLPLRDRHRLWGVVIALADIHCLARDEEYSILGDVSVVLNGPNKWKGFIPASDRAGDMLYNGWTDSYHEKVALEHAIKVYGEWDPMFRDIEKLRKACVLQGIYRADKLKAEREEEIKRAETYWHNRVKCGKALLGYKAIK